jgi:hypothetical protein
VCVGKHGIFLIVMLIFPLSGPCQPQVQSLDIGETLCNGVGMFSYISFSHCTIVKFNKKNPLYHERITYCKRH